MTGQKNRTGDAPLLDDIHRSYSYFDLAQHHQHLYMQHVW